MVQDSDFLVIDSDGVNDFYKDTLESILDKGIDVSPRGLPIKEVRPVMVIIKNPRERFLTSPGRLIHPFFQVMESIWILAGRGDVDFISYYLENIKKYSDGEAEFNAPYGTRMRRWRAHRSNLVCTDRNSDRDQFLDCYEALKKDKSSRQAAMVFWNPVFDNFDVVTTDRPCNIAFQFLIREDNLDLTVFNRSNDLSWGLCNANVVQFSVILETMWMLLRETYPELRVGKQIHFINSLHVYDYQGDLTKRVLGADYEFNVYKHVVPNSFKFSPKEATASALNTELFKFFEIERNIRDTSSINVSSLGEISFSFLKDAVFLAKSYYHYRQGLYDSALRSLLGVKSLDIFVSCLEFISRKSKKEDVIQVLADRFETEPTVSESSIKSIMKYVGDH